MTDSYVEELIAKYPTIEEVWLFGSRANDTARHDSDFDYFVFAGMEVLTKLRDDPNFSREGMDVFVVYDGNRFENPWADPRKAGTLEAWCWRKIDDATAQYKSTKPAETNFGVVTTNRFARKIWPK